jgi:hypothetical protein
MAAFLLYFSVSLSDQYILGDGTALSFRSEYGTYLSRGISQTKSHGELYVPLGVAALVPQDMNNFIPTEVVVMKGLSIV